MDTTKLDKIGRDVLIKLKKDSVPPLPNNFYGYFEDMLSLSDDDFKNEVFSLIESDTGTTSDDYLQVESKIKQNSQDLKTLLSNISTSYKSLTSVDKVSISSLSKIDSSNSYSEIVEAISELNGVIETSDKELSGKLKKIVTTFTKNVESTKNLFEDSIYEPKYQVFNNQYMHKIVKKEIELIKNFSHQSVLISLKVQDNILKSIKDDKKRVVLNKTVSKLMLKVTRRSDFIFHYKDDMFVILFKSMGIDGAKATSKRIQSIVDDTLFFVGDDELDLKLSIGISLIDTSLDENQNIELVIKALNKADISTDMLHVILNKEDEVSV
jgi:GGDEF domain-containing protein